MKKLWTWLARVLGLNGHSARDELAPSGLEYPSLDVDHLLTVLRLQERASENGAANVPHPSDTSPDGYEARIRLEILKRVETARTRASEKVHNLEVSIRTRQLAPAVKRCSEVPANFEQAFQSESARVERRLDSVCHDLADLEGEIARYRKQHGLARALRITEPEDRHNRLALLTLFTLVQAVANAVLFGQGSDYGLALGITFAGVFAFFDILLHFKLGQFGSRVSAPDLANRWTGGIALAVATATVLLINLSMVHLRLVTRRLGVAGWEEWLPSISTEPFGFSDFISWGLFFVGLMCSLLAVQAGFVWDEPIPLLRRNGRRILKLKEDRDDLLERKRSLGSELLSRSLRELESLDGQAEAHVSIISDSVKRIEQIETEYGGYKSTAAATFVALVRSYRDANRRHRTEAAPHFFNENPELKLGDQPVTSFASLERVVAQAERDHDELRDSLPRARARLIEIAHGSGDANSAGRPEA